MTHHFSVRSLRSGAVAAVAAVVLVGCNGGTDPEESPTTAPTTAEVTTPSPTETEPTEEPTTEEPTEEPTETSALPELPEEAKENTPEGAEAFIRYYFDVVNKAYTEPREGLLLPLSDPDCIACTGMEQQVLGLVEAGQHVTVEPFKLGEMAIVGGGDPGVTIFNVNLEQPANEFVDETGAVVRESPALQKSGTIAALWEGERWLLYDSAVE